MRAAAIQATTIVPAPQEEVFAYLSDLGNHWELADRFVDVLSLDRPAGDPAAPATGGRVRVRGPLGITRTAATRVVAADDPNGMIGVARIGGRTAAVISWSLIDRGADTIASLRADVSALGHLDRLLLAAGGRAWLERRFASTVARLAELLSSAETRPEPTVVAA
jgi:Polyketide cyclase / dehydrase and lipid transport